MCVCVCVCKFVTSVRAGLVDQLSENSQQQVEDSGEDGHAACRGTDNHRVSQSQKHICSITKLCYANGNANMLKLALTFKVSCGVFQLSPSGEQTDGSSERTQRADDTSRQSLSVKLQTEPPPPEHTHAHTHTYTHARRHTCTHSHSFFVPITRLKQANPFLSVNPSCSYLFFSNFISSA